MRYRHRFCVRAPVETVARFHSDPQALKQLMPLLTPVRLHRADPLGEGSVTEFTPWLGPLPVRWLARHRGALSRGFVDEQVHGPFHRWVHRHGSMPLDETTIEVVDDIQIELRRQACAERSRSNALITKFARRAQEKP